MHEADGEPRRLVCPQWQGAGTSSVRDLAPEFPFDAARRGYAVGAAVLDAVLPPSPGPTVVVPIQGDQGLAKASIYGEGVAVPEIRKRGVLSRLVKLTENPLR